MGIKFKDRVNRLLGIAIPTCGEEIEYRLKGGGRLKICAVFDNSFVQVDPDTETVVASNTPMIGIRLCDLPRKPWKGDTVIAENKRYHVIDSQEDGQGGATLLLHVGRGPK